MLLVGRLVLHANTQKRSITSLTVNFRPVTQVRGKKISGFTGFSNQRARQQKVAQNKRNSRRVNNISLKKKKIILPSTPPPHTTLHLRLLQSGMMARGPWINPQPDVYASPVCLIGSPPLRTTLLPPHPPAPPPCHC